MAGKKISELTEVTSITDADELVFVDKEGTGSESGAGGKTARITFANLKTSLGTSGQKGEPGMDGSKGEPGSQGEPGEGADSYWTTGSVADTIGYTGKVGIGTNEPGAKLEVSSNSGEFTRNGVPYNSIRLRTDSANGTVLGSVFEMVQTSTADTNQTYASNLDFQNRDSSGDFHSRLYIKHDGNVGIGTASPSATLDVSSSDSEKNSAIFSNTHANGYGAKFVGGGGGDNEYHYLASFRDYEGNEKLRIQGDGNVGIGTDSPSRKLVVKGVDNSNGAYISCITGDIDQPTGPGWGGLLIGDPTNEVGGSVQYHPISKILQIASNDSIKFVSKSVDISTSNTETEMVDVPASSGVTLTLNSDTITSVSGSDNFASTVESGDYLYFYSLVDTETVLFSGAVLNVVDNNTIQMKRVLNTNSARDILTDMGEGNSTINASVKRLPRENVKFTSENGSTYKFGHGMSISTDNSLGTSSLLSLRTSGDDISNVTGYAHLHYDSKGVRHYPGYHSTYYHGPDSVSDGHLWNYMRVMGGTYDNPEPLMVSRKAINGWYGMFGKNDGIDGLHSKDIFRLDVTFNPTHVLQEGNDHHDCDGTFQIQRCFHRTNSSNTWMRVGALTIHSREARTSLGTDLFIRPLETSNYERPIPEVGTISVVTGTSQIIGTDTLFTRIFVPGDYIIANASKDDSVQRLRIRKVLSDTEMLLWWNYRGDATHADDSAGDITDATFKKERVTLDVRPNRMYDLNNGAGRSRFHIEENGAVNITGPQDTHLTISSVHDNRSGGGHDAGIILDNHTGRWVLNAEDAGGDNDGSFSIYKHKITETGALSSTQVRSLTLYDNGNTAQGGPQHVFNTNGPDVNGTATSTMWSQRLVVPATTTAGTGGYTHYTFNIGNYVYGKFTIMAGRTNSSANYTFAEYIVSNNTGTLHSTALHEKLVGGNVEIKVTALNNNQTGLSSNQCQFKIAMNQTSSPGSITVFWQGSNGFASTDHDDSHTNW